jgi:hypothetical protein
VRRQTIPSPKLLQRAHPSRPNLPARSQIPEKLRLPINAQNWNWWPDLLPVVDGITSMGYEQSGLSVDYQALTDHAMPSPQKLTLGVPSYHDTWLNNTVNEQLAWIVKQGQIGVGIWDASFSTAGWQTQDTWAQLKTIKAR